jgi:tetratricopeptide (TPR) repeat protein
LLHLAFVAITEANLNESEALLRRALTVSEKNDDATVEAPIRIALGVIYGRRHQPEAARVQYDRVIALCEAAGDQSALCTALINRGGELIDLDLRDLARQDFARADMIARTLNSPGHIGLVQANLARLHALEHSDDGASVIDLLQASRERFAAMGDRVQHDRIAGMMEGLYQSVLERDTAETTFAQRKIALLELGTLAAERGDTARALELAERLLQESEASGNDEDRLEALARTAHLNTLARNHPVGRDHAIEALALLDRMRADIAPDQAMTIERDVRSILGQNLRYLGDYEASLWQYRAGLEVAQSIGDDDEINRLRGNLGLVLTDMGRFDEALELLRSVVADLRANEDYRLTGHALFNLAYALHRRGEKEESLKEVTASLALLDMINDPMVDEVRRQVSEWV